MCTIANTPRLPEHCIEYAKVRSVLLGVFAWHNLCAGSGQLVQWSKEKTGLKLDGDDPEHIKWLFDKVLLLPTSATLRSPSQSNYGRQASEQRSMV